jgi:hypothetical protein
MTWQPAAVCATVGPTTYPPALALPQAAACWQCAGKLLGDPADPHASCASAAARRAQLQQLRSAAPRTEKWTVHPAARMRCCSLLAIQPACCRSSGTTTCRAARGPSATGGGLQPGAWARAGACPWGQLSRALWGLTDGGVHPPVGRSLAGLFWRRAAPCRSWLGLQRTTGARAGAQRLQPQAPAGCCWRWATARWGRTARADPVGVALTDG